MNKQTTPHWGYKLLSANQINFYHILLPSIDMNMLTKLPYVRNISKAHDGSITVDVFSDANTRIVIEELISFFEQKSLEYIDTPNYYFNIELPKNRKFKEWSLAFLGCLAVFLTSDRRFETLLNAKWEFINSKAGGLFISPYTLLLNSTHPKVIHPITLPNYETRQKIEQKSAVFVRRMIKQVNESQPGFEGLALVSLVERETAVPAKKVAQFINEKGFGVQNPSSSPFFTK
ncbi:MAG TPA: hypothetical protein VLF68_01005 [Candidatus Saccharimonadales bacterium]|nr:hypothetical protein [Candidatus Saccharimonadales bacterium]